MRENRLIFFLLLIGSCLSCQKETDTDAPARTLLVRTVLISGTDSTVTTYSYDSQERLIKEECNILSPGFTSELIINRDPGGIIVTTVQRSPGIQAIGFDSATTKYYYNPVTSRYTSSVPNLGRAYPTVDSIVYTYDVNNRIIADSMYITNSGPPVLVQRNTYTYSSTGNNLINVLSERILSVGGPFTVALTHDFTFDTQISPLILLNEAILLNRAGIIDYTNIWLFNMGNICSGSNAVRTVYTDVVQPANNHIMDYRYWYNAFNMPDSSIGTRTPGGAVSVRKYFYQ